MLTIIKETEDIKNQKNKPPSLIKWSGGKRSTASEIVSFAPHKFDRYFEPFLGGGSVLYYFSRYKDCYASDVYAPLINFWKSVKDAPDQVVKHYKTNWEKLQNSLPDHYYIVRERFNKKPNGFDLAFLSRTCVNGIIRFNSEGQFNNSFHLSRKGMNPIMFEKIIIEWNNRIRNTAFHCLSYQEILDHVSKGDFVYLDPPYLGSQNRYIESLNEDQLLFFLEALNNKNVLWALSFDGSRGDISYHQESIPSYLYKKKISLDSGYSAVSKVLNDQKEKVIESLYLNY
jgi:DNA adenine methylase